MRKLLVLFFCGLMLAACSGDSPAVPTPVPTADEASFRRNAAQGQFTVMNPQISALLKDEPWVNDGTEETVRALQEIVGAQATRPEDPGRAEETLAMVQAMQRSSWYQDGVDKSEKLVVAEVFKTAVKTQRSYINTQTGEQRNSYLLEYDWPSLLGGVFENASFAVHTTRNGRNVALLGVGRSGLEDVVRRAVTTALEHLSHVEMLAGELPSGSALLIVDSELHAVSRPVCGLADQELFIARIRVDCVARGTVIHELVHLSTPFVFATWFEEGTADWISAETRGVLQGPSWEAFQTKFVDATFSPNALPEDYDQYVAESDAGFLFYSGLAEILGASLAGEHIRSISEGMSGDKILESIVRMTPAEKQTDVRNLIRTRCKDTDRFGVQIPCRLPSESSLNQPPTHRP